MVMLPIKKRCDILASGRTSVEEEADHLAVDFEVFLEDFTTDTLDESKRRALSRHIADNLGCDHVEIAWSEEDSTAAEARAVGFLNLAHALEAADKIRGGEAVDQQVWGAHIVPAAPRQTTKKHRASRWLHCQGRRPECEEDVFGDSIEKQGDTTGAWLSSCNSSSTRTPHTRRGTTLGSVAAQSPGALLGGLFVGDDLLEGAAVSPCHLTGRVSQATQARSLVRGRTRRSTGSSVHFAPSPCNSSIEITPYSMIYGIDPSSFDFDQSGAVCTHSGEPLELFNASIVPSPVAAAATLRGPALSGPSAMFGGAPCAGASAVGAGADNQSTTALAAAWVEEIAMGAKATEASVAANSAAIPKVDLGLYADLTSPGMLAAEQLEWSGRASASSCWMSMA